MQRAQIIDLAADGVGTYAIARRLGCCEATVRKWRARMAASPCALHGGTPRGVGRPATIPHRGAAHRGAARATFRRRTSVFGVPRGLDARFAAE
ncbi:MAG: helix-turn-helix domain-containing protein [Polyangiaceae bacterium]|nr:helix-turn-helix domain-containing protein [Polyangiaceae bacterium]